MSDRNLGELLVGAPGILPRRIKRFEIALPFLLETFKTGYRARHYEIMEGIPGEARLVGAEIDLSHDTLALYLEHESFPEVPEGMAVLDTIIPLALLHVFEHCRWAEGTDVVRRR
jgi:hypothetical protein